MIFICKRDPCVFLAFSPNFSYPKSFEVILNWCSIKIFYWSATCCCDTSEVFLKAQHGTHGKVSYPRTILIYNHISWAVTVPSNNRITMQAAAVAVSSALSASSILIEFRKVNDELGGGTHTLLYAYPDVANDQSKSIGTSSDCTEINSSIPNHNGK